METAVIATLAGIAALLILSALFAGSETAFTAASRPRMHLLEQQGNPRARTLNHLFDRKEQVIGGILLGNNLVNILASALATSLLIELFGDAGVVYATVAMTLLVLIFGEVMPKSYAFRNPDRLALAMAPLFRGIVVGLAPITHGVHMIIRAALGLFGVDLASEREITGTAARNRRCARNASCCAASWNCPMWTWTR